MKVVFSNNAPLIRFGLARGWERLGHEAVVLDLWRHAPPVQAAMLAEACRGAAAVFAEGDSGLHRETLFTTCVAQGIPLVYWAIEDPPFHEEISLLYVRHSAYVFTTAAELVPAYAALGLPCSTMLFACDPEFHRRVPPEPRFAHDVVLVASNYDSRYAAVRNVLLPLIEGGHDVKVWGQWWTDPGRALRIPPACWGGLLPYEHLPSVYSSAKIVLGLHCDGSSGTQTSMRTYEALGCGAFYLTQYTKAHAALFVQGVHLEWTDSAAQTLALARRYLAAASAREAVALRGQQLVYSAHTYVHRARQLERVVSMLPR
ncbi:MAG: glycosyltransferase [Bacillota bacterium]